MGRKKKKVAREEAVDSVSSTPEGKGKENSLANVDIRPSKPLYTADQLIDKAEECMDQFNYEVAQKFCQRALEQDPDHLRALEVSAGLLIEANDSEGAKHCLGRAITLSPQKGPQKYFSMAQLVQGSQSVECYLKGIELLASERDEAMEKEVEAACGGLGALAKISRDLSSAHCAAAELFMTDCCDSDGAEERCQYHIEEAIRADPTNAEAFQMKANYLLIRAQIEEARTAVKTSLDLWLPQYQAAREGTADTPVDPVDVCPLQYQTRIDVAKILIELEEWQSASDVLEGLVEEDDEVVETWYLLGWLSYLQGAEYFSNARFYFTKAVETDGKFPCGDEQLLTHITDLLAELEPPGEEENGEVSDTQEQEDGESSDAEEEGMEL